MKKIIFFLFIVFYFPNSVFAATISLKDISSIRGAGIVAPPFGEPFKEIRDMAAIKNTIIVSREVNSNPLLLDVSNKNLIKDLGSFDIQKSYSNAASPGIFTDEKYIYIASEGWGLEVFDASNPTKPRSVGSYRSDPTKEIKSSDVAVANGYAFLAGDEFQIVDVSNLANMQNISRYALPTKGKKIIISGKYAYIRDAANRMYILDISNLQQPNLITTYKATGTIEGMQVLNNIAYIVDTTNMLQVVDFTDPVHPVFISQYKLKYDSKGKDVFISENKAYISGIYKLWKDDYGTNLALQGSLEVVDISSNSQLVSDAQCDYWISIPYRYSTNHPYSRLLVSGKYIYASYHHELVIIEKSVNGGLKMCQKGTRNNDIIAESSIKPKVTSNGNKGIDYQSKVVKTPKGSYKAYMASFDLANPKVKVLTVSASDTKHCGGMCDIKSLKNYVIEQKGVAGINGTQFRNLKPRDGPGAISGNHFENSLFYKSDKKKMHNEEKIRTNTAPMIIFTGNQNWVFYRSNLYFLGIQAFEKQYNTKVRAAFSSADSDGSVTFVYNSKMTKEALESAAAGSFPATVKTTHSIIALKGSKVYFIILPGANYSDAAHTMQALGMEYAINLDGGGSSSLYFNGQYKMGPGRNIPNAIVVTER